jgi:hypothetical protein
MAVDVICAWALPVCTLCISDPRAVASKSSGLGSSQHAIFEGDVGDTMLTAAMRVSTQERSNAGATSRVGWATLLPPVIPFGRRRD